MHGRLRLTEIEKERLEEEINQLMTAWLYTPSSLRQLCRRVNRNYYGVQISAVLSSLTGNVP